MGNINHHVEIQDMYHHLKSTARNRWQRIWDVDRNVCPLGAVKRDLGEWEWTRHPDRRMDILITQLRLHCVKLNKYLFRIKVLDSDMCTKCNLQVQETVEHYLLTCNAYNQQRATLRAKLRVLGIVDMTVGLLLGSSNNTIKIKTSITRELAIYIRATGRLTT